MTTVEEATARAAAGSTGAVSPPGTAGRSASTSCSLLLIAYVWALAPVTFTSFDLKTIVIGGLPLAFAAMAQA